MPDPEGDPARSRSDRWRPGRAPRASAPREAARRRSFGFLGPRLPGVPCRLRRLTACGRRRRGWSRRRAGGGSRGCRTVPGARSRRRLRGLGPGVGCARGALVLLAVLPVIGDVESRAPEYETRSSGHPALRWEPADWAWQRRHALADFLDEMIEIVPAGAPIFVSRHVGVY